MSSGPVHWRRPLRNDGVEFFFKLDGHTFTGSVVPDAEEIVDAMQAMFEGYVGRKLPAPDIKAPRGRWAREE